MGGTSWLKKKEPSDNESPGSFSMASCCLPLMQEQAPAFQITTSPYALSRFY